MRSGVRGKAVVQAATLEPKMASTSHRGQPDPMLDFVGVRRLCGAILYQAVLDAQAGDAEALTWFVSDPWAESLMESLDLDPRALRERLPRLVPQGS